MRNRTSLFDSIIILAVAAGILVTGIILLARACSRPDEQPPTPPPTATEAAALPTVTPSTTATLPPTSTPTIPVYTATPTDTPPPTATPLPAPTATPEPEQGGGNSCEGEFLGDTFHRIVPGDTLWDISNAYYCTPLEWPYICEKNSWISDCDLIHADDVRLLYIPLVVQEVD